MLDEDAVRLIQAKVERPVHIHREARSQQLVHTAEAAQHRKSRAAAAFIVHSVEPYR